MADLKVEVFHSINEIKPETWNKVVSGRGFQSHAWYTFGERAMADSPPTYLVAWDGDAPIAGAAMFRIHNEPLPLPSTARDFMASILKDRPLLICRSPLADTSALLLPGEPLQDKALTALSQAAQEQAKKQRCSFLLFDYLLTEQLKYSWPRGYKPITISEPGTFMPMAWDSFDAYLESGNKKDRQHYKKSIKEAEENGLVLSKNKTVSEIDAALELIRNVSIWHGSAPNPWMRGLLENIEMADGTWLGAHIGTRLVGCGLIFEDNGAQMTTALGLAENESYVYFLLIYASLEAAFEKKVRLLRWGSGAYEVKKRLGFELERDNFVALRGTNPLTNLISQLAG